MTRLVRLPHAGGTAGTFRDWIRSLAPGIEILAVRYPGRHDRLDDPSPESIEDLAAQIAEQLTSLGLPLTLFGHSMGSSVTYEVAQRLEAWYGDALAGVHVSGRPTPAPSDGPPRTMHVADDDVLTAWAVGLGGPGSEIYNHPELRALLLSSQRDNLRLLDTYRPKPSRCWAPTTAFGGAADPGCLPDELFKWGKVTTVGFGVRIFDGDHFYLVPHAVALVDEICSRTPAGVIAHTVRAGREASAKRLPLLARGSGTCPNSASSARTCSPSLSLAGVVMGDDGGNTAP